MILGLTFLSLMSTLPPSYKNGKISIHQSPTLPPNTHTHTRTHTHTNTNTKLLHPPRKSLTINYCNGVLKSQN